MDPKQLDRYVYASANPISLGDPSGLDDLEEGAAEAAMIIGAAAGAPFGPIGSYVFATAAYFLYGTLADAGVSLFVLDALVDGTAAGLFIYATYRDQILRALATIWAQTHGSTSSEPAPSPAPTPGTPSSSGGANAHGAVMLDTNAVYAPVQTAKYMSAGEHPIIDGQVWYELEQNQSKGVRKIPPYAETLPQIPDVINPSLSRLIYSALEAYKPRDRGNAGDAIIGTTAISDGYPLITFETKFGAVVRYYGGVARP
jgi:hypothetical protein